MLTCHWPPVRSLRPPKMNIREPCEQRSRNIPSKGETKGVEYTKVWILQTYCCCWMEIPVDWGLSYARLREGGKQRTRKRRTFEQGPKFTRSFHVRLVKSSRYTSCPNLNVSVVYWTLLFRHLGFWLDCKMHYAIQVANLSMISS